MELTNLKINDSPDLVLGFTEGLKEAPVDSAPGKIEVWFRPLTGGDEQAINDAGMMGGEGGRVSPGAGVREMLIRSTVKIRAKIGDEFLTVAGEPIDGHLTGAIHDALPRWVVRRMSAHEVGGDPKEELG